MSGEAIDDGFRMGINWFRKVVLFFSFVSFREAKDGEILEGNARYEGYSLDLIDHIARLLNFKYEFHLTPDGRYGGFNKQTQKWDGLVGQLLDGVSTRIIYLNHQPKFSLSFLPFRTRIWVFAT